MKGDLVPFRRKANPVWSDGRIQTECDELVHLFDGIPGRCQCGERLWVDAPAPAEDGGSQPKETETSAP